MQRLMDGLKEIFEENDIPVVMTGYPSMFSFSLNIDESEKSTRVGEERSHVLSIELVEKALLKA
ncbi:MAG: hypothetical protein U0X87_07870 [Anaerolineales bacterium]